MILESILFYLLGNSLFSCIFVKKVKLDYEVFSTYCIHYFTLSFTRYRTEQQCQLLFQTNSNRAGIITIEHQLHFMRP